jgi:hypothetical protein
METRFAFLRRAAAAAQAFIHRVWQQRRLWQVIKPGPAAARGAATAILVTGALVYLVFITRSAAMGPWPFAVPAALALLVGGALLLFLGQGIAALIEGLAKIPWRLRWATIGTFAALNIAMMGMKDSLEAAIPLVVIALAGLVGAGINSLRQAEAPLARAQSGMAAAGLVVGTVGLLGGMGWYLARGQPPERPPNAAAMSGAPLERVALPDPSLPGSYAVRVFTYGSGTDRYRAEFGRGVTQKTEPVDGSILLGGTWSGLKGTLRSLVWGFDQKTLPLNGRAWYPVGEGPFPLVLMVHGNHNMMDFSDPGYAYLGELLASRGYIFVSVDENFLNGGLTDFPEGISGEIDARGWLLLEHLRLWHAWNGQPGHLFDGKVDTGRIAVGGHSRGGEAAAVAAAFNRLPAYPDNGRLAFRYGYNIRAVAAIAPSDGFYNPALRAVAISGVNYFTIQGSHDSDLESFIGLNQYERVDLEENVDLFKAALYVYGANHGQFNTTWGDDDVGGLVTGFLNRAALLAGEQQRQVGRVYLSAFLDSALKGERGYLPLFQDARAAGGGWLPDTIFLNRFDRSGDLRVADFQEDVDLQTATLPGGAIRAEHLVTWREQRVHSKWGGREASAVYLGWNEDQAASYTIDLAGADLHLDAGSKLIFNLADAGQDPAPAAGRGPAGAETTQRQPLDLSIFLKDARGVEARVRLGDYLLVQPQLEARLYKARPFERDAPSEPFLQSYVIPLEDFAEANLGFDPERVAQIRFVFDRTERGSIVLDAVGFR